MSRDEAISLGLKKYADGFPCRNGHVAERYVKGDACVQCAKEYRLAHKEHIKQMIKDWHDARPTYKAEWQANNQDKVQGYREKYGPAYFAAGALKSYYKNKEANFAHSRNRKARLRAAEGRHSAADIRELHALQRHRCANCRKPIKTKYHVDHIVPLSKNGRNDKGNLQLLCGFCNMSKHDKDPLVWAQKNGRLL